MKTRSVTIHESLFETALSLKPHSRSPVPLFDHGSESSGAGTEDRLLEGFHIIRRLWAMAARVIQVMESSSKRPGDARADTEVCHENIARLSEAYFEMIALMSNLPALTRSSGESSSDVNRDSDQHLFDIFQRQRTSYLITLHVIKVLVLNSAIQCKMTEVIGLSADAMTLSMRQIELAQDFLNALESVPFLHLQAEGEPSVSSPKGSMQGVFVQIYPNSHVFVAIGREDQTSWELIARTSTQCGKRCCQVSGESKRHALS